MGSFRIGRLFGLVALASCAGVASAVPVTTWNYDGVSLQHVRNDDGEFWVEYDYVANPGLEPNVSGGAIPNGLELEAGGSLNDRAFSLTGATYRPTPPPPVTGNPASLRGNRMIMTGTATIDGTQWDHPDDTIRTSFFFGFGFSGGAVDMYAIETGFGLFDAANNPIGGVGSGTGFGVYDQPAGYGFSFDFVDRFPFDMNPVVRIEWSVAFYFDWSGYAPTDTFEFDMPSVVIQAERIPAPGAGGALALIGALALRRRR